MRQGLTLLSSLMLGACASTATMPVDDAAVVSDANAAAAEGLEIVDQVKADRTDCVYILRDLSVPWSARDYWCTGEGASSDRSVVIRRLVSSSLAQSRRDLAAMKSRLTAVSNRANAVAAHIQSSLDRPVLAAGAASSEARPDGKPGHGYSDSVPAHISASATADAPVRIAFATGREVLGPRGRRMSLALLARVKETASVTLRGYLLDGEFPLTDSLAAERRSVGRSLSVRKLWRDSGIDVSNVSILHHDASPATAGRYVEVVFHD